MIWIVFTLIIFVNHVTDKEKLDRRIKKFRMLYLIWSVKYHRILWDSLTTISNITVIKNLDIALSDLNKMYIE